MITHVEHYPPAKPVRGCAACERQYPEAYIRVLEYAGMPVLKVCVDGHFDLCRAHAAALFALIGPPRT